MAGGNSLSLKHLDRMTDSTGLIQHCIYSIPRLGSGYTTDDNARALRLIVRLWESNHDTTLLPRIARYFSFLEHARSEVQGFHNLMGYSRNWLDTNGCDDCHGQAILALAEVLASNLPGGFCSVARELIDCTLVRIAAMQSLRAQAYIVQAFALLVRSNVTDIESLERVARIAADRLADCYLNVRRPDWFWFEQQMTYANAVIPHAMFDASLCWSDSKFYEISELSFDFLDVVTTNRGCFWPIGNQEWYSRGKERSLYAQQPVEASTMVAAALVAFELSRNRKYLTIASKAFHWFHGKNSINESIVDIESGACFDGLELGGINENQGAESTLAWLWTQLLWNNHQASMVRKNTNVTSGA